LNGTCQLLVFTGDNLLCENVHTIKKNTEALLISSKEVSPEVNTYKKKGVHVSTSSTNTG